MQSSTLTGDRILDAAMDLFADQGFRATSITQIESAAGLTPGAGGIYHHFKTKNALLEAGVDRQLQRLSALRDIRAMFSGLGDLRIQLTLVARYGLAELDREQSFVRIIATESRSHPALMRRASEQLIERTFRGFSDWLAAEAGVSSDRAESLSAVALGSLLSHRLLTSLQITENSLVSDERFIVTWVDLLAHAL